MKFKLHIAMLVAVLLLTTAVVAIAPTAIAKSSTGEGGIVTGSVIDSNGVPIADAMIMLSNNQSTMDSSGMMGLMAMTDGNGTFVFRNVSAGSYDMAVSKDGYNAASSALNVSAGQTTFTGEARLEKTSSKDEHGIIVGAVQDPSGLPIPNVMVMLSNNKSTMDSNGMLGLMAMTGGNGTFAFQNVSAGTYNISFSESSHAATYGNVNVTAGRTTSTGTVVMKKAVTANSPIGGDVALNSAIRVTFSEALNKSSVRMVVSGVNGTLVWRENTTIFTPSSLFAYNTIYSVIISGNDQAGNPVLYAWSFTTMKDEGIIIGFVQDPSGLPIPNVMVMLSNNQSTMDSSGMLGLMAMTDGNGTFVFRNVSAGSYDLAVSKDGYNVASSALNVSAGQTIFTGGLDLEKKTSSIDWMAIILVMVVIAVVALLFAAFLIGRKKDESTAPKKTDETIVTVEQKKELQEEKK